MVVITKQGYLKHAAGLTTGTLNYTHLLPEQEEAVRCSQCSDCPQAVEIRLLQAGVIGKAKP